MFIALFLSTLFTLIYDYIAANIRRAEQVLIPLLDILQSAPIFGFLSIPLTAGLLATARIPRLMRTALTPIGETTNRVLSALSPQRKT